MRNTVHRGWQAWPAHPRAAIARTLTLSRMRASGRRPRPAPNRSRPAGRRRATLDHAEVAESDDRVVIGVVAQVPNGFLTADLGFREEATVDAPLRVRSATAR